MIRNTWGETYPSPVAPPRENPAQLIAPLVSTNHHPALCPRVPIDMISPFAHVRHQIKHMTSNPGCQLFLLRHDKMQRLCPLRCHLLHATTRRAMCHVAGGKEHLTRHRSRYHRCVMLPHQLRNTRSQFRKHEHCRPRPRTFHHRLPIVPHPSQLSNLLRAQLILRLVNEQLFQLLLCFIRPRNRCNVRINFRRAQCRQSRCAV